MGARRSRAAMLAVLLLGMLPLLVTRPAPLQDWPNHIARMHVLTGLLRHDAFWMRHYRLVGFLVPDAALDVGMLGLARLGLPIELAAQLFLVVTYLVFVSGFCALAHALGAFGAAKPGFAVLLFYGNALFWGLVNYVLGIGLLLGLLALWLDPPAPPRNAAGQPGPADGRRWRRFCIAGAGAVLLLFTHVVAAVAWIVVLGCFDLCRLRGSGTLALARLASSASWLVALVAVAALLHALPGAAGHDFSVRYAGTGVGGFTLRKLGLFGKALLGGSLSQDAASLGALLACVVAVAFARPSLATPVAVAAAGLALVTLAAPERVGTGSVLDVRLAILPLLLLAAGMRFRPERLAMPVVTTAVLARTVVLAANWHAAGLVFRDFRQQAAGLPAGSVMMVAYGTRLRLLTWQQVWSPAITSIATQSVFGDLFVPALFANPAQQPIALRPAYAALTQPWNLTDADHLYATADSLAALCRSGGFPRVYLTVLYPGGFMPTHAGAALLHAQPDFLILDACRLPMGG